MKRFPVFPISPNFLCALKMLCGAGQHQEEARGCSTQVVRGLDARRRAQSRPIIIVIIIVV